MKIRVIDGCVPFGGVDHVAGTDSAVFELEDKFAKALFKQKVAEPVKEEKAKEGKKE